MDELVAAGRRYRAAAPAPPARFERIAERARSQQRRRRMRATVASTFAVVLAGGAVWAGVRSTKHTVGVETSPTDASPAKQHAAPLSPQMRAHLGLDAPKGWVPVDVGSTRIWVPSTATSRQCSTPGDGATSHLVTILTSPSAASPSAAPDPCAPAAGSSWIRVQPVPVRWNATIIAPMQRLVRGPMLNGYATYEAVSHGPGTSRLLIVSGLLTSVTVNGPLGDRILHSLGPSARTVVNSHGIAASTHGWRAVSDRGVSFLVPPRWEVIDANGRIAPCRRAPVHSVTIGEYASSPSCPAFGHTRSIADDLPGRVTTIAGFQGTPPINHTVHIGGSDLLEWDSDTGSTGNTMMITVDGVHGLVLELDRDGRVDAAILASLHAVAP